MPYKKKSDYRKYRRNYFRNNLEQKEKNKNRVKLNYWINKYSDLSSLTIPQIKNMINEGITIDDLKNFCKTIMQNNTISEKS